MKIDKSAQEVVAALRAVNKTLATAESCTGGGIGYILTSVPGSSAVYLGGVVSYANSVKEQVLHVPTDTLSAYGAVSHQTAKAMAEGARSLIKADIAVSVTGIAGPASDDTNKPVGLVYIGVASEKSTSVYENHFTGDREQIRELTIDAALRCVLSAI